MPAPIALLQEGDSSWGLLVLLLMKIALYLAPVIALVIYFVRRWRRARAKGVPGFHDKRPRSGIVYTKSELEAHEEGRR